MQAAEKALSSPLLDLDLKAANKALINITGGSDMTLGEAEAAVQAISKRMAKDAHIIWGASIDDSKDAGIRVLAVMAGITPHSDSGAREDVEDLSLDFV